MSNPQEWNRVAYDPSKTAPEREIVPGIAEVSQPLMLFGGEWMCPGCQAVISEDEEATLRMLHGSGCSVIAAMVEQARGQG